MHNVNIVKQPKMRSMSMQDYDVPVKVRQRNISVIEYSGVTGRAAEGWSTRRSAGSQYAPGQPVFAPLSSPINGDEEPLIQSDSSMMHNSYVIAEEAEDKPKEINSNVDKWCWPMFDSCAHSFSLLLAIGVYDNPTLASFGKDVTVC